MFFLFLIGKCEKNFKKSLYFKKKKHHVTHTSYNSHSSLGEKAKLRRNWDAKKPNQATGPGNSLRTFFFSWTVPLFLLLPVSSMTSRLQARLFSKCNGSKISWRGKAWNSYNLQENKMYDLWDIFIYTQK